MLPKTLASCYGMLVALLKLKHLAPFHLSKGLAESLVLVKPDYVSYHQS